MISNEELVHPWSTAFIAFQSYMHGEGIPEPVEVISLLFSPENIEIDFEHFMKILKRFIDLVVSELQSRTSSLVNDTRLLLKITESWISFYSKVLPFIQLILSPVDDILESDKLRTMAFHSFAAIILNEHKPKLLELFSCRKPELLDGMKDSEVLGRLHQMLSLTHDSISKKMYLFDEYQLTNEIATRRASMADPNRKRKNSSITSTSRRASVSRSNTSTIKGLFKQNSQRMSFADTSSLKTSPKPALSRKSYGSNSKDILELKEQFEKNWLSKPSLKAIDILILNNQQNHEEDAYSGKENTSELPLKEFSSNDLTSSPQIQ